MLELGLSLVCLVFWFVALPAAALMTMGASVVELRHREPLGMPRTLEA